MIRGAGRPARIGHRADGSSAFSVNALAQNSTLAASFTTVQRGSNVTLTLTAKNANGVALTTGGETVTMSLMPADGIVSELSLGAVTDLGNGTYRSYATGTIAFQSPNTVSATIAGGTVQTTMPALRVWDVPSVTTITPTSGGINGGSLVTISGTSFDTATTFKIGSTSLSSTTIVSQRTAIGYTPTASAGAVNVVATTFGSNATLTNGFTYYDVLFQSDWSVGDITNNSRWSNYDTNNVLSVVSATGLGFPATMLNVLKVEHRYPTVKAGHVAIGLDSAGVPGAPYPWSLIAVGQSLYFRIYTRAVWDSDVRVQDGSCHFIEAVNTSATNGLNFYKDVYGFHYSLVAAAADDTNHLWRLGHRGPGQYQNGDAIADGTYRHEWKLTRQGTDSWDVQWRVYDTDDTTLLYDPSGTGAADPVVMNGSPGTNQATAGVSMGIDDDHMRSFWLGTNGGTFTAWSQAQYSYYGGFMVRNDDWCGAY